MLIRVLSFDVSTVELKKHYAKRNNQVFIQPFC